ncbi:MAG: hypothetical protein QM727_15990 [Niabella sp.]
MPKRSGSARWYRGFATVLTLAALALAFWPDFSAVEAATTVSTDTRTRDEYRSQRTQPLARAPGEGKFRLRAERQGGAAGQRA